MLFYKRVSEALATKMPAGVFYCISTLLHTPGKNFSLPAADSLRGWGAFVLKYNQRYFQNRRFTIGSNFASNVYVRSIGALCLHGAEKIHCPHRHSVVVGFSCAGDAFWLGRYFQDPVF